MSDYQHNYASGRPQMYHRKSREQKAKRMVQLLEIHFGKSNLKKMSVLEVGSSTGIICNYLAHHFKNVTGIDIDSTAIEFAKTNFKQKNLKFKVDDSMRLSFKKNSFDIIICAQVYEHVPNAKKLFAEIHRTLKPNGTCYLAALNCLWPLEPHYNLLFLAWLPKTLANSYLKVFRKEDTYYENIKSYWKLKKLTKKFKRYEYTQKILRNPKKFGFDDKIKGTMSLMAYIFSPLSKFLAPTFFWILEKE